MLQIARASLRVLALIGSYALGLVLSVVTSTELREEYPHVIFCGSCLVGLLALGGFFIARPGLIKSGHCIMDKGGSKVLILMSVATGCGSFVLYRLGFLHPPL